MGIEGGDVKNAALLLIDIGEVNKNMISSTEIMAKYEEFYKEYSNNYIDDYEIFVRSRVIEYFFQLSNYSIDKLTSLVNTILDGEKTDFSTNLQQENVDMDGKKDSRKDSKSKHAQGVDAVHDKVIFKWFLLIVVIVGLLVNTFLHKK